MIVNIEKIEDVLMKSLEDACGLTAYKKTLDKGNINSIDYQKNFTNYYRVRRDACWLEKFYAFLEKNKDNTSITFKEILMELSSWEHNIKKSKNNPNGVGKTIEASFASKLLATINPNYPIWDSQVVRALNISIIDEDDKITTYVKAYSDLCKAIKNYIESEEGKVAIVLFNKQFPNYEWVSNYKKIDFYLWNIGKN
jgi:hypothetical protein